jgi:hypothetical protein
MRSLISPRSRSDTRNISTKSLPAPGTDVDRDLIRAWWRLRCLLNVRWLLEHGFGPSEEMPEIAVLRTRL